MDVDTTGSIAAALPVVKETPPQAVVVNIRQTEGNGLTVARELRNALGAEALVVLVGSAELPLTAQQRQAAAAKHGIDLWVPRALDPVALETVLWTELTRRFRPREAPRGAPGLVERLRGVTGDDVKTFLTKERYIIPTPPRDPEEEPGWIELFNSPPTPDVLKKLLTKDIAIGKKRRDDGAA
jgi:DNA-binding response OmpR family regulator